MPQSNWSILGHVAKQLLDYAEKTVTVCSTTGDPHIHIVHTDPDNDARTLQ
jgi:hypothetical protein